MTFYHLAGSYDNFGQLSQEPYVKSESLLVTIVAEDPDTPSKQRMTNDKDKPMADLAARLDNLEIHIAHQDETIETMSRTIEKQWREIDRLSRSLERMTGRLQAVEESVPAPSGPEAPPPHY